jgi:LmbE family N-acetylglucosaminyl deacetylase
VKRILVVAAHPDDEVLGCGASVAKHAAQGDRVWTLILGEGITSRSNLPAKEKTRLLTKLRGCSRRANAVLQVEKLILKHFPDNRFDTVPRLEIIRTIEKTVELFHPDTIYTHSPIDLNIDHQITSEAVQTACRPVPGASVRQILAFEVPSSTEWRFDAVKSFHPNTFADVAEFLDKKVEALANYKTELREFPHPRSQEYVRALALVRGGQAGFNGAEAFCLLRSMEP